ncbi:hypothetical protein [Flavobacterium turcicum]|uniref:Uncharacterized protein n=1 Tax=Flavobacterium turcicum TaxID=2764718 RepID=A0ABR7JJV5_9FLAO|nr:hypothetical protein [Flavobacterium turcicum]MBC5864683.1 hypothetical protein [Flavobacterium turcicum]NHL03415.1 hypothetical protein [Flavobacterium turcicum]
MKKPYLYFIFQFLILSTSFAQQKLYDEKKITKETELNLAISNYRGIEDKSIVYFLENDNQTLSAYESGKLKWKTNVVKVCGKPKVGEAKIRYIKLNGKVLNVTFGKHSWAEVDVKSGITKFIGSD